MVYIFLLQGLVFFGVGCLFGLLASRFLKKPNVRMWVRRIGIALWIGSVVLWISVMLYFKFLVEPRLDGTEGVGVGYGQAYAYVGLGLLFMIFSGFNTVFRRFKKGKRGY